MNKYLVFAGIGFELIALIILSVVVGEALEEKLPTKGLWVAGLILLALVGWFIHIVYLLKSTEKSVDKNAK